MSRLRVIEDRRRGRIPAHRHALARQAFEQSAKRLGVDYLDAFLIHWPNPWLDRYVDAWQGLIKPREDGREPAGSRRQFPPRAGRHRSRRQVRTSPAQIVLRWHLDLGLVTAPRSSSRERIAENIDVFDFRLAPDEVAAMSALDRGERAARDSDSEGH